MMGGTCKCQRCVELQKSDVIVIRIQVKSFMTNDFVNRFAMAGAHFHQAHITREHHP